MEPVPVEEVQEDQEKLEHEKDAAQLWETRVEGDWGVRIILSQDTYMVEKWINDFIVDSKRLTVPILKIIFTKVNIKSNNPRVYR